MKHVPIGILCIVLFAGAVFLSVEHTVELEPTLFRYFVENGTRETGAQNIVAGILLNYRMYDTVFEAMILLTAVMGMLHFLYHDHTKGKIRKRTMLRRFIHRETGLNVESPKSNPELTETPNENLTQNHSPGGKND